MRYVLRRCFTILRNRSLWDVVKFDPSPLIRQTVKWDFDLTSVKRCKTFLTVDTAEHGQTCRPSISIHLSASKVCPTSLFIRYTHKNVSTLTVVQLDFVIVYNTAVGARVGPRIDYVFRFYVLLAAQTNRMKYLLHFHRVEIYCNNRFPLPEKDDAHSRYGRGRRVSEGMRLEDKVHIVPELYSPAGR